jgi:mannose-1-phosphate guanylyltransferase
MFLFKAEIILNEINKYNPNLRKICSESLDNAQKDLVFTRLEESSFKKANNISIDTAVMEKTKSSIVMPLNVGWSDIGSWKSIWEIEDKDPKENVSIGKVFLKNSRNCYVRSDNRLVVGIGLDDLIIVETRDAILITKNNSDQEVKNVLNELKENSYAESKTHKKIHRPWGNYLSLAESDNWQVKRIEVNVNGSLSLQLHMKRSEHWIVVKGN